MEATPSPLRSPGFCVTTVDKRDLTLHLYDLHGGRPELWPGNLNYSNALMYVVDASDTEHVADSMNALGVLLQERAIRGGAQPILIFANKQDLARALPPKW